MLIPDVLALPLAEAIARLEAAEIGYTVADTQPPRRFLRFYLPRRCY